MEEGEPIRVENYNGDRGYVPNDRIEWDAVKLDRVDYLIDEAGLRACMVVHEGDESALAITITNDELIGKIDEARSFENFDKQREDYDFLLPEQEEAMYEQGGHAGEIIEHDMRLAGEL
jgi:hypothetical protein